MMTSKKLFALLEELSPSGFSEEVLLMWLSNCENSILTDVLLLSHEECKEYTQVTDAPLFVPHPFDKLYLPYMQAQMHHAYGETDKYRNYMALYNAYRDEYAVHLLSRFEPAYGEAIKMGYYLTAYGLARAHGYQGSEEEWLRSLIGPQGAAGKSAYTIALENGFEGDAKAWLKSLVGPQGAAGKSAYEVAKENGFEGDEKAWLASLAGGEEAIQEAVRLGAVDVTQAYEAAVAEGAVKSVREFLWTLPAGQYYLKDSGVGTDVHYHLHAMAGEEKNGAVRSRLLYVVNDFCDIDFYSGKENGRHDAVPAISVIGDSGEIFVGGKLLGGKDGVDGKDGKDGADGKDGTDGADGADGYTPVRGKDYFTPEDVAQIVAQASAEAKAAAVEEALSVMRAPTLLPQDTWYQGNTARTAITEIRVMDSYTPPETDAVVECWNADTTDQTVVGRIRCYIVNDTELIIAGDGSGRIMANPDSKLLFAGANASKVYTAVERISGLEYIDTRNVTTLQAVFNQMTSLRTLSGYENWDVSRCTKFRLAFNADSKLEKLDLSKWEVSKAVDAAGKEGNVNVLDGSVMGKMLHNCHALRELKLNKSFDLRFAHLPVPRDYKGTSVTKEYRWLDTDTLLTYEDKDDDATVTAAGTVLFAFGDRVDGTVGGDGLVNPADVGRNVTFVADFYEGEVENV